MTIIKIDNISKKYSIHHERDNPYASLKEIITDTTVRFYKKMTGQPPLQDDFIATEDFFALKNLSLEIEEGDRVALLGRNGAGKSTLLKILARITEPTTGKIQMRGRVASLLEVGTGFHPELTGKENIMLNGAILGMSYKEIKSKFDEIVAFADIEKFLDTPIKRYSSGMFMRLGFAIAAHLDIDLLIVDEVLAVGDAQFQEKCINKMNEMGSRGNTILFVSHNVNSVLSLCNKGLFLEKGELKAFEPIESCVNKYMKSTPSTGLFWTGSAGDDHIQFHRLALQPSQSDLNYYHPNETALLEVEFEVHRPHPNLSIGFSILNSGHQTIAHTRLSDGEKELQKAIESTGRYKIAFPLECELFHPGEYQIRLDCSVTNHKKILHDDIAVKFAISSNTPTSKKSLSNEKDGISLGNRWKFL